MHLFIVNMFGLISLFLQRPHGTVYWIVQRILFCILEFKMRQYPDIRVGRQETGRKKSKSNEILLKMSVGVSWEKNFSFSHCSSWRELLTERGLEQIQAKTNPQAKSRQPVFVWPVTCDFLYFKWLKNQRRVVLYDSWILYGIQILVFIKKSFIGTPPPPLVNIMLLATFKPQSQRWVFAAEAAWHVKPSVCCLTVYRKTLSTSQPGDMLEKLKLNCAFIECMFCLLA